MSCWTMALFVSRSCPADELLERAYEKVLSSAGAAMTKCYGR